MVTRLRTKTKQNRAETERRLIESALDLIRRNGVLAGLNLRQVADGAGVNRGNIYHYFGSRRELVRTAIARRFERVIDSLLDGRRRTRFVERRLRTFRLADSIQDSQFRALLVIDGDETVDPMPRFEDALNALQQDVKEGDIHEGHDLEALQVALSALSRGYRIFRKPFATRVKAKADDLDERVARILLTWLEVMAEPPAPQRRNPQPTRDQ